MLATIASASVREGRMRWRNASHATIQSPCNIESISRTWVGYEMPLLYQGRFETKIGFTTPANGISFILALCVYLKLIPFAGVVNPIFVSNLPWYNSGISYPTHVLLIDSILHGDWIVAWDAFLHLILPSLTLALAIVASIIRILRASMLEVLEQDYIRLAWSKGIAAKLVYNLHARKNALLPVLTLYGLTVAGLLGGAVVVETVFSYPGIGYWTTQALLNNDVGGIMPSTLLFGLILVTANLVLDILYAFVDPRIRY